MYHSPKFSSRTSKNAEGTSLETGTWGSRKECRLPSLWWKLWTGGKKDGAFTTFSGGKERTTFTDTRIECVLGGGPMCGWCAHPFFSFSVCALCRARVMPFHEPHRAASLEHGLKDLRCVIILPLEISI